MTRSEANHPSGTFGTEKKGIAHAACGVRCMPCVCPRKTATIRRDPSTCGTWLVTLRNGLSSLMCLVPKHTASKRHFESVCKYPSSFFLSRTFWSWRSEQHDRSQSAIDCRLRPIVVLGCQQSSAAQRYEGHRDCPSNPVQDVPGATAMLWWKSHVT